MRSFLLISPDTCYFRIYSNSAIYINYDRDRHRHYFAHYSVTAYIQSFRDDVYRKRNNIFDHYTKNNKQNCKAYRKQLR